MFPTEDDKIRSLADKISINQQKYTNRDIIFNENKQRTPLLDRFKSLPENDVPYQDQTANKQKLKGFSFGNISRPNISTAPKISYQAQRQIQQLNQEADGQLRSVRLHKDINKHNQKTSPGPLRTEKPTDQKDRELNTINIKPNFFISRPRHLGNSKPNTFVISKKIAKASSKNKIISNIFAEDKLDPGLEDKLWDDSKYNF